MVEHSKEGLTVYVLTRADDYEGESSIGVYATPERAQAEADRRAFEYGWDAQWKQYDAANLSPPTMELSNGCSQFVIREEIVR